MIGRYTIAAGRLLTFSIAWSVNTKESINGTLNENMWALFDKIAGGKCNPYSDRIPTKHSIFGFGVGMESCDVIKGNGILQYRN